MDIAGRKLLIVGMARSGIAAAGFAATRGARVTINDSKPESELTGIEELKARGIEIIAGSHPDALFENSDLIVVSPGVPLALPQFERARRAGVPVVSEVELAARFLAGRLIGITGSNGKTTTTTLVGELLEDGGLPVQVGGNIGAPLISLVETSRSDTWTVAELSSFQLEAIDRLHTDVAVLINITPDHLDRYDSMDDYAAAKSNIFRNQTEDDLAVLNADDERVSKMDRLTRARSVFFSRRRELDDGIFLRGTLVLERRDGSERVLIDRSQITLMGDHNLENVMAALAVGSFCGVPAETMRSTIARFKGVEHRLEFVAEIEGIRFYNDSKATNVDAAIKSLEAFPGNVIAILGGKDKGGDFAPLARLVRERCRAAILIGAAAPKIEAALDNTCPLHRAATMEEAVDLGFSLGSPGDVVLLAPACASFDMFTSYEHRGRVFKEAVKVKSRK
ncbi:MAG: UDP-N-acetylmuramoyl-L-alanine--D-glutamate ligase [Acidobacteriota bacterium]|nr:MAG: UDP-N-acetylmuramoyl-L-alanine--D-glutamate ligase [Acidobacteriota bacterium]